MKKYLGSEGACVRFREKTSDRIMQMLKYALFAKKKSVGAYILL